MHADSGSLRRSDARLRVLERDGLGRVEAEQIERLHVSLGMRLAVLDVVGCDDRRDLLR